MRKINFISSLNILLAAGIFLLYSCSSGTKEAEIQELDPKYLSESQLFALNTAIDDDPENPENYYKRAKVYLEREQEGRALKDIEKAIKIKNTEGKYFLLQSRVLEASGHLNSALQAALTAESLKANQPEVKVLLTKLYLKLNQKRKAKEYLDMASLLNPHHSEIPYLGGKLAALNGDTVQAINSFGAALRRDQNNLDSYKELSEIYFNKHKYDSAMIFNSRGRAIEPEDPFFYYMDGRLMEQLQYKQAARQSYLTSIKMDSTFPQGYKALAMMTYRENDYYNAAKYFEKELLYNPASMKSSLLLAEIYELQNRGQLAIPLLEKVVAADSTNEKAKASLQRLYVLFPKKVEPVKDTTSKVQPEVKPDSTLKKPAKTNAPRDTTRRAKQNVTVPTAPPAETKPTAPEIKNTEPTKQETPAIQNTPGESNQDTEQASEREQRRLSRKAKKDSARNQ